MVSEPLLEGKCVVRKNMAPHQTFNGLLVFDEDLRKYKILANGVIAFAFGPLQIKKTDYDVGGKFRKKQTMGIYVTFPDGNEYLFDIGYRDAEQMNAAERQIRKIEKDEKVREEILLLLRSRDRVTVKEICSLLAKEDLEADADNVRRFVDFAIANSKVMGTFNGTEFINRNSAGNVSVQYNVAVKMELSSSGALSVKCPSCGSSLPLDKKESNVTCPYCGQQCFIPRKVLDMI